VDITS